MSDQKIHTVVDFKEGNFSHLVSIPALEFHVMGRIYVADNTDLAAAAMSKEEKYEGIKSIIERGRISSYRLIEEDTEISVYFTNRLDAYILMAGIYPRRHYKADFHQADESANRAKPEDQLRKIRSVFNHTSLKGKVSFALDADRHVITAAMNNGNHMVDLFGISRRMKIHQKLFSTPDPAVSLRL